MSQRTTEERDYHGLCDRLAEVFNEDDTPDELCTEAREAIEELWEQRDHLRNCLIRAGIPHMLDPENGDCRPNCWCQP